jgi:dTDP-4-dehydrorhamnose 3,5-epimerase
MVQCSISFNRRIGTLRGLHFQTPPSHEARLLRCTSGTAFSVVLDIRPDSATFLQHVESELVSIQAKRHLRSAGLRAWFSNARGRVYAFLPDDGLL